MVMERRDIDFLLFDYLKLDELPSRERFQGQDVSSYRQILDTAEGLARDYFSPHAAKSDANEPHFDGTKVHVIGEVKEALTAAIDAGFLAAGFSEADGGMQLPYTLTQAASAIISVENAPTWAYLLLTVGAANLLSVHGTEQQKRTFMDHMIAGRFFGTMCLSEPQAGSSLADIRTKAEPQADGTYRLFGSKMWISGGDHELSENIIHLVLAKIPGGPAGVKGISLFIVPKFLVNPDGSLGARNDVKLAGLNHKMGYRGTTNAVLSFGEKDGAVGYLVGQPHHGLACMFHMMNEARIGVGQGAATTGYAGYRHALAYTKTRAQGRLPQDKDPTSSPVPIIQHADVRRLLLNQKAYVEGALALCLYGARLIDDEKSHPDPDMRKRAAQLLEFLTPIIKSWPSEYGLEANKMAIQCLGGYGYTRDFPLERLYRDNRLNPIHEGTTGIQALDLLGRKAMMHQGALLKILAEEIEKTCAAAAAHSELESEVKSLRTYLGLVGETTMILGQKAAAGEIDLFLANATLYLDMVGHVVLSWVWLQLAMVATGQMPQATGEHRDFLLGKLAACRFFFRWELPKVRHNAHLLKSFDPTCLEMKEDWF